MEKRASIPIIQFNSIVFFFLNSYVLQLFAICWKEVIQLSNYKTFLYDKMNSGFRYSDPNFRSFCLAWIFIFIFILFFHFLFYFWIYHASVGYSFLCTFIGCTNWIDKFWHSFTTDLFYINAFLYYVYCRKSIGFSPRKVFELFVKVFRYNFDNQRHFFSISNTIYRNQVT